MTSRDLRMFLAGSLVAVVASIILSFRRTAPEGNVETPAAIPSPTAVRDRVRGSSPSAECQECLAELERLGVELAHARNELEEHQALRPEWPEDPAWQPTAVQSRVWERGLTQESIEILDVDCDEHPCIVWSLWRSNETSDAEPRHWLSPSDDATGLWSHSYTLMFGPYEDRMAIQAFSMAPRHDAELLDQRAKLRIASREREISRAAAAWIEDAGD